MRLLIVSQYFWPENFRINDLAAELCRRGHDVTVLTGQPNYPDGKVFAEFTESPEKFSCYHGVRIVRVRIWPRGKSKISLLFNYLSYATNATLFGMICFRNEHYDAIFVPQYSPVSAALPAIVLRRFRGWPVALWVLDQWPETLEAVGAVRSKLVLKLVGRFVSFIYNRCDLILSQSKSLMSVIEKYCETPGIVTYFPSWAELSYDINVEVEAAPEIPVVQGSFNIMFAGNIGEAQDFPVILDAAEYLKAHSEIRWLIVGDGRMASWVKNEVVRRGLQEIFILLGRYPVNRMLSFYQHADAMLVSLKPSPVFSMTLPGKIQSYLAAGIPILGLLDGEGAYVINDAQAGFSCKAGDSKRFADTILRMAFLTVSERHAMGEQGRIYSQREYDRGMLISKLESWLIGLSLKN